MEMQIEKLNLGITNLAKQLCMGGCDHYLVVTLTFIKN